MKQTMLSISLRDGIRNEDIYRKTHKEFSKNGKGTYTQSGESMAARWKFLSGANKANEGQ